MNNIIKSGFPRILCRLVLAILLVGMCQFEAGAVSSRFKQIGHLDVGSEKIVPLKKSAVRKAAARSGSGISASIMCNQVGEESYSEYSGIHIDDNYVWSWQSPDDIIYEENQTVLNYATADKYFYFRSYNDAPVLEAIKIHLDPTKTNNASVSAVVADFESGALYYSDTQIVADYANNIIYWKPDTKYDQDNIFFYIESGELNIIGFDIYSEGNTPSDFLSNSNVSVVTSPVFRPKSCSFTTPISVEILAEDGCNVYYRTDGYAPTVDEQYKYNGPIVISATTTFKAIAADAKGNTSRIVTSKYTCTRHGIGEGYNPESPGNPGAGTGETQEKTYKLTVVTNPSGAGSAHADSYDLKAGTQTHVYTYNNTGFNFLNWTIEGEEVSKSTSFYYVMPEYDVTIVANYSYNPASPGNPSPEEQKVKHPVVVRAIPSGAASLSPSGAFDMEENASRQIYAYPNTGWHLTGWTINGEKLQSTTSPISITMGEKALDIVAYFSYNPSSPSNPGANYYNPTTGQVIIDDFTPGYLYDALCNLVGYDNFPNISSLIVKGEITSNDLGNFSYFSNAGTIDISRTGGVSVLPGYAFYSVGASSIVLPSTISSLGNDVFCYCENLASLTVYAQEPPTCNSETFSGFTNKANCTVYVPAYAIELYSNADYWKDFTILPITSDAHVLQVNLPADASDGRYKHNSLEIVNINSGVRQKYVISDRMLYTFNGLQKDEQYNIYMYSQAGLEIGRIENVVIPDQDIEVTFDNLKSLHTVFAEVLASDGTDVTSQVSVEWLKPLADGTVSYLRKAVSLGEIPDGQQLICRVTLDNKLGVVYANPEDGEFTVDGSNNICTITLVPFRSVELSGSVVDGDGTALSGASVSVNQALNGKYSKTYTCKTDRKGQWSLAVLDAPETRLTYSASECVNVNDTIGAFATDGTTFDLGKKVLKSIVGARVSYGFTYHAPGSEDVQDYYSDYQNVAISVLNVTQNRAHNDVSLQYPILAVLDENINTGDELKLTATSKTGAFNPIEKTVTVGDNQRAEVIFDIIGKGGIEASFEMTDNPAVIALLYSSKGELLKKQTYSEAQTTFTDLEDGDYTLVSMGQSDLMNSILRLSSFSEIGLTEGKDYVKNTVKVQSGKLSEVKNAEIPAFDESLFYYTNSSTGFSSNKSSITTGNYLTLSAAIDFKGVYKKDISNVALVVDLPEACGFVEQSVIQGPNLLPYTLDNNRLIIQLGNNYHTQTRFCVIPINGGAFNATASIVFDYNGKTLTQPIGSAIAQIKDLEITVPSIITSSIIPVRGSGKGKSNVKVYCNDNIIGETTVLADGTWKVDCTIPNLQNLSDYKIYAVIKTLEGLDLQTASKTAIYDKNTVEAKTVTMTFYNGWLHQNVSVVFDFETKTTSCNSYMFYTTTSLTFIADLSENSPEKVSGVDLFVYTDKNEKRQISLSYDESLDKWVGTSEFSSNNLPINLSISINAETPVEHDRSLMTEVSHSWKNSKDKAQELLDTIAEEERYEAEQAVIIDSEIEKINEEVNALLSGFETGMSDEKTDELYSKIGIDLSININIPENADIDWLNEVLDNGDIILSTESDSIISDETYNQLIADSERVMADDKGINEKEAFESILQDKIEVTDENGKEVILYQIKSSDLTDDLTLGCDTTSLSMTDGPAVLILNNEETGVTIITDEYNDVATVIINHQVSSNLRSLLRKANKQNDFVAAMKQGATDASNLANSIISFIKGIIDEADDKVKNLKNTISDYESHQAVLLGQRAGTSMQIQDVEAQLRTLKSQKVVDINEYRRLQNQIADLTTKRQNLIKEFNRIDKLSKGLTKQLNKMRPLLTGTLAFIGQVNELWGIVKGFYDIVSHTTVAIQDHSRWKSLINAIEPCKGDEAKASSLKKNCESDWTNLAWSKGYYPSIALTTVSTTINGVLFTRKDLKWLVGFVAGVVSGFLENTATAMYNNATTSSTQWYPKRYKEYQALKCEKRPEPTPEPPKPNWPRNNDGGDDDGGNNNGGNDGGDFDPINPIHDPSGFVYEAVPENRIEGVQATIYYKETKEDMYGDPYEEIVLWDAEEYAQKNPLFTDEHGMYQWDVPQGLWQVKFEKDGYVTAYSEWLPVPPPQLDVNIGIVQNKQPEVTEARAYEEGVEVQFDKFMDLSTLTTDNIYVTANGEKLNGEIRLIDSALADEYANEDDVDAIRYASRVRFVPEEKLSATTGEIRLTVSRNVLSYAGIPMTETFSQVLDVEKEVQVVYADDVKVLYGGEKEVTVYALPYEAAVGRKLHIANSSDLIASIDITEANLDEEGKAVVKVKGDLPGRAQLTFTIDDVTATGECAVDVVTEIITAEAPKSSRASGTAVYRGTKVELTTESKNATIYFTTDGSCPCDENGTRRKYTVPIIINDDTQILAMTSIGNGDDDVSEIVQFNYTLKRSDMDFQMKEGWTWMSHNFESAIAPAELAAHEGVSRIMSQTQEVIRDPQLGMIGTLTELSASESYKVETTAATPRQRLSDIAWNPATPIAINSGWNWLGYPVSQTMSVDEAFAMTNPETLDVVVGQNGFAQFDGENWIGTLETMSPGMGYMYQSQSAKNVVYNTSIVSNASAKYVAGISANSPLVLDIHKYGTIMPVVAIINNADGSSLDNEDYQVAAFCGSECRGIGRVVNGLVMMNVYGNVNDPITFYVTDADGEISFDNNASLNFSETVIGDIFNPYAITINNQSGIADVKYSGNIKVTVDGDMLRIKGIPADNINLVEVYDIKGQKLIRETHVSESGIRISTLTNGVYVVIVNGNGEYTYHKIAVC